MSTSAFDYNALPGGAKVASLEGGSGTVKQIIIGAVLASLFAHQHYQMSTMRQEFGLAQKEIAELKNAHPHQLRCAETKAFQADENEQLLLETQNLEGEGTEADPASDGGADLAWYDSVAEVSLLCILIVLGGIVLCVSIILQCMFTLDSDE
jgi:hypothetical protein